MPAEARICAAVFSRVFRRLDGVSSDTRASRAGFLEILLSVCTIAEMSFVRPLMTAVMYGTLDAFSERLYHGSPNLPRHASVLSERFVSNREHTVLDNADLSSYALSSRSLNPRVNLRAERAPRSAALLVGSPSLRRNPAICNGNQSIISSPTLSLGDDHARLE